MKLHHPRSIDDAVSLLSADEDARCLAGGATLVAMMNADLLAPGALVSLRDVDALAGISVEPDGTAVVGAMTNHVTIAETTELDGGQRVVARAAAVIGHPAIRNMGTIGGSIAHADPAADYPSALVAANATVCVAGAGGAREIPAEDFFVDYLETSLEEGEIVTSVRLPAWPEGVVSAYEKFARVEGDFATVSIAVAMTEDSGGIGDIRLAVGACAPVPVRSAEAEDILKKGGADAASILTASEILAAGADPVDDFRGTGEYRLKLIPTLVARAIENARANAGKET